MKQAHALDPYDAVTMERILLLASETQDVTTLLFICNKMKQARCWSTLGGITFMQFAFRWMNCLLMRELELNCIVRLWDTYLSESSRGFDDFHVYVCASFLTKFRLLSNKDEPN